MYNGSVDFWACMLNDDAVQNVYSDPVPKQKKCAYFNVEAVVPGKGPLSVPDCTKAPPAKPWSYPWDKYYNNSAPASPATPEGQHQMEHYGSGTKSSGPKSGVSTLEDLRIPMLIDER